MRRCVVGRIALSVLPSPSMTVPFDAVAARTEIAVEFAKS